jgi:RNA polymerase sigma factor (sigma-70 family)
VVEERQDARDLSEFAASRSAEAFARLSTRYAGLVYRVCLRRLKSEADAEDATQAVFVALARKAGSVKPDKLAAWLHGASIRAAKFIARSRSNRARYEREAAHMKSAEGEASTAEGREALMHLDGEIGKLPSKLREAVARHYLAGLTRAELARELGVPEGTVQSRLNAGLEKLRARLGGRGAMLGATALASLLASEAQAGAPAALVASLPTLVSGSAAAGAAAGAGAGVSLIAEGVLKAMLWTRIKIAAAVIAAVTVVAGAGTPLAFRAAVGGEIAKKPGPEIAAKSTSIKARVIAVKSSPVDGPSTVTIDRGSSHGVKQGFVFEITRDGKQINDFAVRSVTAKQASGKLKFASAWVPARIVKVGDLAATRFKVVDPAAGVKPAGGAVAAPVAPKPPPKGVRQLVRLKAGYTLLLAPSPRGEKLALLQGYYEKNRVIKKGGVILVDTATGKSRELSKFKLAEKTDSLDIERLKLVWSPDGSKFLFGDALNHNLKITVFDKNGKQLAAYPAGKVPQGRSRRHRFGIRYDLLPSPDGRLLALHGTRMTRITFRSWDGALKGSAELGGWGVRGAAWTPDSRKLRVMLYEQVKNPKTGKLIGQYRVNAVRSVTVAGGNVEVVKCTQLEGEMSCVYALSSNGLHALMSTGNIFMGKGKYHLVNMSTGGAVDIEPATLVGISRKLGPKFFFCPPGGDGCVIPGKDDVLRYISNQGKITEIARGPDLQRWITGSGRNSNHDRFIAGERVAFTVGTDLCVARLGVPGSTRVVAKGWLRKKLRPARPARGRSKARPASISYQRRMMWNHVVFSRDGRHLFGVLNTGDNKGGAILEIPVGK